MGTDGSVHPDQIERPNSVLPPDVWAAFLLPHADSGFRVTVVIRHLQCAVKGTGPQREINPPGNWIAPPGSNRSGGGGNKAAGASGVEGRIRRPGKSAGCNASER
jgi:hypothetical protein